MVNAILVTHGLLGSALIRAAETILGPQDGLVALSNREATLSSIAERVRTLLEPGEEPVFIFVDLVGGSCCHAALLVARDEPRARVISGVNLPMLLEFLHYRRDLSDAELGARLVERGRDGIRQL